MAPYVEIPTDDPAEGRALHAPAAAAASAQPRRFSLTHVLLAMVVTALVTAITLPHTRKLRLVGRRSYFDADRVFKELTEVNAGNPQLSGERVLLLVYRSYGDVIPLLEDIDVWAALMPGFGAATLKISSAKTGNGNYLASLTGTPNFAQGIIVMYKGRVQIIATRPREIQSTPWIDILLGWKPPIKR